MDFFLSKPIRRPALKHVLKTYCPPIPEEESEATTPPAEAEPLQSQLQSQSQSNGGVRKPLPAPISSSPHPPASNLPVNQSVAPVTILASTSDARDSAPVSPMSQPGGQGQ
jgi:osomolarity two-component system, sensor histidine kinase SLN1